MIATNLTTTELEALPTLSKGWCGDLKGDDGETRVWLYRVGLADGAPFENTVQVEHLRDGRWETAYFYNGDDTEETVAHGRPDPVEDRDPDWMNP